MIILSERPCIVTFKKSNPFVECEFNSFTYNFDNDCFYFQGDVIRQFICERDAVVDIRYL